MRSEAFLAPDRADSVNGVQLPGPDLESPFEIYHENSKLYPATRFTLGARIEALTRNPAMLAAMAHPNKKYATSPTIPLPREVEPAAMPLVEALARRRSTRDFDTAAVPLAQLSQLLRYGAGLRVPAAEGPGAGHARRTYPSGGGLYPLELYLSAFRIEDLPAGVYHYRVDEHLLERLEDDKAAGTLKQNVLQADAVNSAAALLFVSAIFQRSCVKYGERGYRFVLLEAGHLMQNLYLLAAALGLGFCAIGGFYDDDLHRVLRLDGVDEAVVYTAALGRPSDTPPPDGSHG